MLKSLLNLVLGLILLGVFFGTFPDFIRDFNEYMRVITNVTVKLEIHIFYISKITFKVATLFVSFICLRVGILYLKKNGLSKIKTAR